MKPGSYSLHELFASQDIEQLLVPEMQRDYVWGERELGYLLDDLLQAARTCAAATAAPGQALLDEEMYRAFQDYYSRQVYSHALGFVYAYHDPAYPGKMLLIDGQQRLTTLYLLLLACAVREGAAAPDGQHFAHFYLWHGSPKVDYRVREAAQTFLGRFVTFLLAGGSAAHVREQYWYLAEYDDDLTIQRIVANYDWLTQQLAWPDYAALSYDYLRDYVQVQYFDTNLTTQGEELYLSLNATGHPTEEHENLRAWLLEREPTTQRPAWGRKWEEWQQFFWRNRGSNPNADLGFDEFLRWLYALRLWATGRPSEATRLVEGKGTSWDMAGTGAVTLAEAEDLLAAVRYVQQHLPTAALYFGSQWLAGGDANRRQLRQVEVFRLLPVLRYCLVRQATPPAPAMLQRVARYFYNLSRSRSRIASQPSTYVLAAIQLADSLGQQAEDIAELPDLLGIAGQYDSVLYPAEEQWKLRQYRYPPAGSNREEVEAQLWALEDDEANRGQVAHLFPEINEQNQTPLTRQRLAEVHGAYQHLFLVADDQRNEQQRQLQTLLLSYGTYWQTVTPYYYTNCAFDEWYHTVRHSAFRQFFAEFAVAGLSLIAFYRQQQRAYFRGRTVAELRAVQSVRKQLFILATAFEELKPTSPPAVGLWQCGNRIGYKSRAETQNSYPFFTHDICYVNARQHPYKDRYHLTLVDDLAERSGHEPALGVDLLLAQWLAREKL